MPYNRAKGTYNGHKVILGTSPKDVDKLMGLRNDTVYMPMHAFRSRSQAFIRECTLRNIEVRILP